MSAELTVSSSACFKSSHHLSVDRKLTFTDRMLKVTSRACLTSTHDLSVDRKLTSTDRKLHVRSAACFKSSHDLSADRKLTFTDRKLTARSAACLRSSHDLSADRKLTFRDRKLTFIDRKLTESQSGNCTHLLTQSTADLTWPLWIVPTDILIASRFFHVISNNQSCKVSVPTFSFS